MRVLVVGGGAREHALVWKLAGERLTSEVLCAPGNAGIARLARCLPIDTADPQALLALASREQVDLTIIGPESPLACGVVDLFEAEGRAIFGPTRAASRLESSKVFAKDFMARHDIPTARYRVCDDQISTMRVLASGEFSYPLVIKADGLAAGKGVAIVEDRQAAEEMVRATMIARQFGEAGARLVIEEFLEGCELSLFVVCAGGRAIPIGSAQDYKRALDGDTGPNTGGMGAIAPHPLITPALNSTILREIVNPVLVGMQDEGDPFSGILYVGLILTAEGPRVLEFNVRLGDPEAQVVLPGLEEDLMPLLVSVAAHRLGSEATEDGIWRNTRTSQSVEAHVGVVLASAGYPGKYQTGHRITGLDEAEQRPGVLVFHAGTARQDSDMVTQGGRVMTVVGKGADYEEAAGRAYDAVARITFEGMYCRRDIARGRMRGVDPEPGTRHLV